MLNPTSRFKSVLSTVNSKKTISALLLATLVAAPTVSAKLTDDNWFPRSDLMLPRQMSTSELNNGFRYVLMPTVESGFEIRLDSGATALPAFNASPETEEELLAVITMLADSLKVEVNMAEMDSSSLVVVGNFNVSKVKREILSQFSTSEFIDLDKLAAKTGKVNSPTSEAIEAAQQMDHRPEVVSIAVLSDFDIEDSKKARREKLTRDVARSILSERLEKAYERKQLAVTAFETNEVELFDHKLMTTTTVVMASEQDVEAGFDVLKSTLSTLVNTGVSRQEFETHVTKLRSELTSNKVTLAQQADQITTAIQQHKVYLQPSDELMLFDFHIAHMHDSDVTAVLMQVWNEHNGVRISKGATEKQLSDLDLSLLQ